MRLLLALLLVVAWPGAATAAPGEWRDRPREPARGGDEEAAAPADPVAVRGRDESPDIDAEDVALALPRAVLSVPRMVLRFAFLPVRLALSGKSRLVEKVEDLLYNDERTAAILPTASFFGDQGLTLGVTAFHEALGQHDERVEVSARFGGRFAQSVGFELDAPRVAGSRFSLSAVTRFEVEPFLRFYGYGSEAPRGRRDVPVGPREAQEETVFLQRRSLLATRAGFGIVPEVDLGVVGVYNNRQFEQGDAEAAGQPTIARVYDTDRLPGFDGYAVAEPLLSLIVDTRAPKGIASRGVYLHAFAGGSPGPQYRFAHWAAEAVGFIDIHHGDRVLVLRAAHEGVSGGDDDVPFADLPRLGGPRVLRGYDLHRFRDHLTASSTVEYRWPIHPHVDGALFLDTGIVGARPGDLVQLENILVGVGGGLQFRSRDTPLFSVQVAYGDSVQLFITTDAFDAYGDRSEQL